MSTDPIQPENRRAEDPSPCHLRIWHSATSTERRGDFEMRCEQLLPAEELAGADRFRQTTSRNQHVVGRAMARRLLADRQTAPQAIRFAVGSHGKPTVAEPPAARRPFNIAHTDGLVLCGIADGPAESIGVDVESTARRTSTELAERYFSRPEVEFLRSQRPADQHYYFLRIWTLKEAFIKAIGTGLQTPLSDFAFESIDSRSPRIRFLNPLLDRGTPWTFVCFHPREGFVAAAAISARHLNHDVRVDWLPFEEVV